MITHKDVAMTFYPLVLSAAQTALVEQTIMAKRTLSDWSLADRAAKME